MVSTEVGFTATVMMGSGGPIFAIAISDCAGKLIVAPCVARNALIGTVNEPSLLALRKATTVTAIVQLLNRAMAGTGKAVNVICEDTLASTAVGQVFVVGGALSSRKFTKGSATLDAKSVNERKLLAFPIVNVRVEISPSGTKSGVNTAFTVI